MAMKAMVRKRRIHRRGLEGVLRGRPIACPFMKGLGCRTKRRKGANMIVVRYAFSTLNHDVTLSVWKHLRGELLRANERTSDCEE